MLRVVERSPGAPGPGLEALWGGEIDALVIPEALPAAPALVSRLDGDHALPRLAFGQQFAAWSYGRGIDRAGGDLDAFFAQVDPFVAAVNALFAGLISPVDWMFSTLGALTGGEALAIPRR